MIINRIIVEGIIQGQPAQTDVSEYEYELQEDKTLSAFIFQGWSTDIGDTVSVEIVDSDGEVLTEVIKNYYLASGLTRIEVQRLKILSGTKVKLTYSSSADAIDPQASVALNVEWNS